MDLVGPLPTAQGNYRLAAVAVDYFTKWVEAKALGNIKVPTIQNILAEHSLQIWVSKRTDRGQWETIRLLFLQRILQNPGNSHEIFISIPPTV
jgi:hypothetical protein